MVSNSKGHFYAKNKATSGTAPVAKGPVERFLERTILFGELQIPVTLHVVTEDKKGGLVLLDKKDMGRVGMRSFNKTTSKDLPKEDVVKGFETGKGKFVIVSTEDLQAAMPRTTQMLEIECTVNPRDIPAAYFLKPYRLQPTEGAKKSYALLCSALSATRMVGLARVVIATLQYIALIVPDAHGLSLHLLHWSSEIKPPKSGTLDAPVAVNELTVAKRLVRAMVKPWRPADYIDRFPDKIKQLVERKDADPASPVNPLPGEQIPARPEKSIDSLDLGALLKSSLKAVRPTAKSLTPKVTRVEAKTDSTPKPKAKPVVGKSSPSELRQVKKLVALAAKTKR